jgi:hypothetical protein
MRNGCLRHGRTCASAIYSSTDTAPASRFQSVHSLYGPATAIPADCPVNPERRSRLCRYGAGDWTPAAHCGPLAATDSGGSKAVGAPPPPRCRGSHEAAGVFLLLRAFWLWLWLRLAAELGRILVPSVALFMTNADARLRRGGKTDTRLRKASILAMVRRSRAAIGQF